MKNIRNIYCIGRNYVEHIKELNNEQPKQPLVFTKPTHALVEASGGHIELPSHLGEIHYEVEIVVQLKEDYDQTKSVEDLIGKMYLGIDLTLRDVQQQLKNDGHPWLISKGFKNSAILSSPTYFPGNEKIKSIPFSLKVNDQVVQTGKVEQMIFSLKKQIDYIGQNLGLKSGDIIFTGTPSGVGALQDHDELTMYYNEQKLGSCTIKLV